MPLCFFFGDDALDNPVDIMDLGNSLHISDHLTSTSRRMLPEVQVEMAKAFHDAM
jgi:hypothetical protein